MIAVIDASAAVELALRRAHAEVIERDLADAEWVLAPTLFVAEVTNTMWKYHHFNELPIDVCEAAIDDALSLPDTYVEDLELARETFALAAQTQRPAYDALYLVLARRHNATLLTLDAALQAVARKHSIRVAEW